MKKAVIFLTALMLAVTTAACGAASSEAEPASESVKSSEDGEDEAEAAGDEDAAAEEAASPEDAVAEDTGDIDISEAPEDIIEKEDAAEVPETGKMWQYTYAGNEHSYLEAISKRLCEIDAEMFEMADGMIPCFTILQIDNDDESDIKVFGIYDISNYNLTDGVLVEQSGGRFPGVFHLEEAADGTCTVTDEQLVMDDDQEAFSAMTEGYDLAAEGFERIMVNEEARRWYISEFVKAEGLDAQYYQPSGSEPLPIEYEVQESPEWVAELPEAAETNSLIVVDVTTGSNAVLTMHEKGEDGKWMQTLDEAAFIGKNGPGKTEEGDLKTPLGTFGFNAALGINDDPGCAIPYTKVDDTYYWVGDSSSDMYNKLVTTTEYTDFDPDASELIVDYPNAYKYILNTTYNEDGTPMKGSAIFLHCYREQRTYTGGCISIPFDKMEYVMTHVQPDSKIIIRMKEA